MSEVLPNPSDYVESVQPICKICNHSKCPHCSDWCDVVDEKGNLCCDGCCTYE